MIDAEVLRKSLGIAGYLAASVTPSGQGYLVLEQPARLDRDRLASEASVEVDPVLEWISGSLSQESSTSLGAVLITPTRFRIVQEEISDDSEATTVLDVSDIVAGIRAALSLQIKEIAAIVGVERPTVYAWLQGKSTPFEQNRNRLIELFSAARKWQSFSSQPIGKWVRFTNPEGESILSLLSQATVPERRLHRLMRSLADKAALEKPARSTAREVAEKHGVNLSQIPDQSEQVDTITERRISEE